MLCQLQYARNRESPTKYAILEIPDNVRLQKGDVISCFIEGFQKEMTIEQIIYRFEPPVGKSHPQNLFEVAIYTK